jgi:hypothetical protein
MSSTASSSQHGSNSNVLLNSIRINAPVVQEWPWENGLPLEHGSMASSLQNSLRLNSTQQEQDFVDMVLVSWICYLSNFSSINGDL